jgi:hypothetical protein
MAPLPRRAALTTVLLRRPAAINAIVQAAVTRNRSTLHQFA